MKLIYYFSFSVCSSKYPNIIRIKKKTYIKYLVSHATKSQSRQHGGDAARIFNKKIKTLCQAKKKSFLLLAARIREYLLHYINMVLHTKPNLIPYILLVGHVKARHEMHFQIIDMRYEHFGNLHHQNISDASWDARHKEKGYLKSEDHRRSDFTNFFER